MTVRQMRKARHENQPLNYCVPEKALDSFRASMETAMHDEHGRDLWMVFHLSDTAFLPHCANSRCSGSVAWSSAA